MRDRNDEPQQRWRCVPCAALLAATVLTASVQPHHEASANVHGPALGIAGDRFTVDGTPRFLIFVSYFDGLRAPAASRKADLDWLRKSGVSGVRVFANWHHWCAGGPVTDGVIGPRGTINRARLDVLMQFVEAASARGLLVDLSFDHSIGTGPMSLDQYAAAVAAVAKALADFENVLVDIENEYQLHGFSDSDVAAILQTVRKNGDAPRLLSASRVDDARAAGTAARAGGMDFVAYHDPRSKGAWFTRTSINRHVLDIRAGLKPLVKPIYFQEPESFDPGPACQPKSFDSDVSHAAAAIRAARASGIAAWTFHTRAGFDLSRASLFAQLTAAERRAMEGLRDAR